MLSSRSSGLDTAVPGASQLLSLGVRESEEQGAWHFHLAPVEQQDLYHTGKESTLQAVGPSVQLNELPGLLAGAYREVSKKSQEGGQWSDPTPRSWSQRKWQGLGPPPCGQGDDVTDNCVSVC